MPHTLAGSLLMTVLLAALGVVIAAVLRRTGTGAVPDPLWIAWRAFGGPMLFASAEGGEGRRRWFRRDAESDEEPVGEEDSAPPEPESVEQSNQPRRASTRTPGADHIEFGVYRDNDGSDEDLEPQRLRERLRLGMRKTRDYLNRDVREVFGAGPIPETFDELEELLIRSDVGVMAAAQLSDELRERGRELTSDTLPIAFKQQMRDLLRERDRRMRVNPDGLSIWLVVGVNGTGKTTTIAKLAKLASNSGFSVVLAAGDTFRAAAVEQLQTWGERLGLDVIRQHPGADPAAVVFDAVAHAKARNYDLLIVDTAGRLQTQMPLMDELKKIRRIIARDEELLTEVFLVLDATTGQNGVMQAKAFKDAVDVTGLVLAKLDGTAKGGIVFAIERELEIPVKAIGLGETADDLAPFDPDSFVEALFE